MSFARLLSTACAAALALGPAALLPPAAAGEASFAQDTAIEALQALGLADNPAVSWDSRDAEGGGYRFTNLRHEDAGGAAFTASTLIIDNPRMGCRRPDLRRGALHRSAGSVRA